MLNNLFSKKTNVVFIKYFLFNDTKFLVAANSFNVHNGIFLKFFENFVLNALFRHTLVSVLGKSALGLTFNNSKYTIISALTIVTLCILYALF